MSRLDRIRWEDDAACKDADPEDFFELENAIDAERVADPVAVARALDCCARCPILDECFRRGVYTKSLGIWGGTTAEERGLRYRLARKGT